jgi:hypothetical protein
MQKENSTRPQKVTINYEYINAGNIQSGDRVTYKPADKFEDGEMVVLEGATGGRWRVAHLYNVQGGKRYRYYIKPYKNQNNREMLYGGDGDSWIVLGVVAKVRSAPQSGSTPKRRGGTQAKRSTRIAGFDWDYFGVHRDDVLIVEENGQAPIGKLILLKFADKDDDYFSRVCCVKGNTVRGGVGTGNPHDEPLSLVIGPVVEKNHDNCVHTKIEDLREEIARLLSDHDAWSNVTRVYELETEIFNLEHLAVEDDEEDDFEWPEVVGDE